MGARQLNIVLSMIKNKDRVDELTNIGRNSAGATAEAQSIWEDSLEAKLKSLTNSAQIFWQNFISSDTVKGGITLIQGLIDGLTSLQKIFGSAGLSLGLLTTAFITFTNNPIKNFIQSIAKGEVSLSGLIKKIKQQVTANQQLKMSFDATGNATVVASGKTSILGLAFDALGIKAMLASLKVAMLQAVLTAGLSLAIMGIVGVIGELGKQFGFVDQNINNTSQNLEALTSTMEEVKKEKEIIGDLAEIDSMSEKTKSDGSSLYSEEAIQQAFNEKKQELIQMDSQYGTILNDQTKSYKEQLTLVTAIADKKAKDKGKELLEDEDLWSQSKAEKQSSRLDSAVANYKKWKEISESSGDTFIDPNSGKEFAKNSGIIEQYLKTYDNEIKNLTADLGQYNNIMKQVSKSGVDLSAEGRGEVNINSEALERLKELQEAEAKVNEERLKDSDDEWVINGRVEQIKEEVKALLSEVDARDDLTEAEKRAEKNRIKEEKKKDIITGKEVTNQTSTFAEAVELEEKYRDMLDIINEKHAMTPELIKQMAEAFPDAGKALTNTTEAVELLNDKIKEQQEAQGLALAKMVGDDEAFYQEKIAHNETFQNALNERLQQTVFAQNEAYNIDLSNFTTLNGLKEGVLQQMDAPIATWMSHFLGGNAETYKKDLANFVTLASKKDYVLTQLGNHIAELQKEYANLIIEQASSENLAEGIRNGTSYSTTSIMLTPAGKKLAEISQAKKAQSDFLASINSVSATFSTDLPSLGGSPFSSGGIKHTPSGSGKGKNGGKTGSKKSGSDVANLNIDDYIDRYYELDYILNQINADLEVNELRQKSAIGDNQKKLLEEEVELYKKKRDAIRDYITEQQKEKNELIKELRQQGLKVSDDGFISNRDEWIKNAIKGNSSTSDGDYKKAVQDAIKGVIEDMKSLTKLVETEIPKQIKEWEKLSDSIKDVYKDMTKTIANGEKEVSNTAKYWAEKTTDDLKSEIKKRRDALTKSYDEDTYNRDYENNKKELEEMQRKLQLLKYSTDRTDIMNYKDLLKEYQEKLQDFNDFINDHNKKAIEDRLDEEEDLLDKRLEDYLKPENLTNVVKQALQSGTIQIFDEILNVNDAMNQMIKETEVGYANVAMQQTEQINNLKTVKSLYKDIANIMKNAEIQYFNPNFLPTTVSGTKTSTQSIQVQGGDLIVQGNIDSNVLSNVQDMINKSNKALLKEINKALNK